MNKKRFALASAIGALILSTSITSNAATTYTGTSTVPLWMTNDTVINNGDVILISNENRCAIWENGGTFTNNGSIQYNVAGGGFKQTGIYVYGSAPVAINNGLLKMSNTSATPGTANTVLYGYESWGGANGRYENNGTIDLYSNNTYYIIGMMASYKGDNISAVNSSSGIIKVVNDNPNALSVSGITGPTAVTNNGKIDITSTSGEYVLGIHGYGSVINYGTVDVITTSSGATYGIYSAATETAINNANINVTGISATKSNIVFGMAGGIAINSSTGVITVNSDYGVGMVDSVEPASNGNLHNYGLITVNGNYGLGMLNTSNTTINEGIITLNGNNSIGLLAGQGDSTYAYNNPWSSNYAGLPNKTQQDAINSSTGTINVNGTDSYGILVNQGNTAFTGTNNGIINVNGASTGMYLNTAGESKNTGTITVVNGGTGARIENGNFYNNGTISAAGQNAIIMDGTNQVLELGNGTNIDGLTDGGAGEDTIVLSGGTINVGTEAVNFEKIVSTADTTLSGTVNLNVSDFSDYATAAFGTSATPSYVWNDAAGAAGVLTVAGTVNIDVDYDGISSTGTNKTGKIIANDVVVSGGSLVLQNGGTTTNSIQNEVIANDASATEFYVNDVVIVSTAGKAQAVDPGLFTLGTGMTGGLDTNGNNWSTYTAQTFGSTNGSGAIGQRYYINNTPAPEVTPEPSYIIIPRNRVDLDNANQLQKTNLTAVNFNSEHMEKGEKKLSFDYQGTVFRSDFDAEKEFNYDYDVKSNGFSGTLVHKITDRWTTGVSLGYSNSLVDYKGINAGGTVYGDSDHEEQINSFNGAVLGRYTKGRWDFDANLGIGFDVHKLSTDFVGQGIRKGEYYSHLLKGGLAATYNKKFENNNIQLLPTVGIEYNNVNEDEIYYDATSSYSSIKIDEAKKGGFTGKVEVKVKENEGKFRWDAAVGYKYNFVDTFHEDRYVSGTDLKMEQLHYAKGTIMANANVSYVPNDKIAFNLGYNYEKNKNFDNSMIKAGFTINLNETK